MVDDIIGALCGGPLRIEQPFEHRPRLLQKLEHRTNLVAARHGGFSGRRVDQVDHVTGQRREGKTMGGHEAAELRGRRDGDVKTRRAKPHAEGDIGLDIAARAHRLNGNAGHPQPPFLRSGSSLPAKRRGADRCIPPAHDGAIEDR